MNSAQDNAVNLRRSPWVLEPVTYLLAIQVLEDALAHHQLDDGDRQKISDALPELQDQYQYALSHYEPLKRVPRE